MKKSLHVLGTILLLLFTSSLTVSAAEWKQDSSGWWWQNDDGTYPTNCWQWLDGNSDGIYECYYFDNSGYLLMDTATPDEHFVNSDGAWIIDGTIQQKEETIPDNSAFSKSDLIGTWKREFYYNSFGACFNSPGVEMIITPKDNGNYEIAYWVIHSEERKMRTMVHEITPSKEGDFSFASNSASESLTHYYLISKNELVDYSTWGFTDVHSYFTKK